MTRSLALRGPRAPRRITMLAYPGAQMLDITGPVEVFARSARLLVEQGLRAGPPYEVEVVAERGGPVKTSSGVEILAARPLAAVRGRLDTLLVAGGVGSRQALRSPVLLGFLRRMAPRVRRLASVCTGAFLLAEAGLLDGRRATTHWAYCDELAKRYPQVEVDPDPIFVRDGRIYTSAGVTAGMDLALGLVEEDLGRTVALEVARQLVLFLKRPGGQSQFSAQLAAQSAEREPLRDLQAWISEHPEADLGVESLARRVAMSPRHFARVFLREVGVTPAKFIVRMRVEAARRRLEESPAGVESVAASCGFGSAEVMRRAFLRTVRVSPSAYRSRFRCA
ncbi:MAG TPA: GlxA family transcriptional regulator [Myxococcota bacterium]|nr:GlxA family transcriptional regulator [Myxococcota bacterium]